MKKNILIFLFSISTCIAQKELWNYQVEYNYGNPNSPGLNDGKIMKVPLTGSNQIAELVHTFDVTAVQGKFPVGRLFQASNGKLYGVTSGYRDYSGPIAITVAGVLFEYDLIFNKYRVVATGLIDPQSGVIEPIPGFLYGTTNSGNSIFKFNISTESLSIIATIPFFYGNGGNNSPQFKGELTKASDGFVYGVTDIAPSIQNNPNPVGFYRLNLTNNQLTRLYVFGSTEPVFDIIYPTFRSKLVEGLPGKLYGTAYGGTHFGPNGIATLGSGTLYEYSIATNTMLKKFDFDYNTNSANPSSLTIGGNGKLYGSLSGTSSLTYPNPFGSIFEFDLATQTITLFHNLDPNNLDDNIQNPSNGSIPYIATDGNLYGISKLGIYKYDPIENSVVRKIISTGYFGDNQDVIEICSKPRYHFFNVDTFDACVGSTFTYDVQNTNATSYQWLKNNVNVVGQTTGILNLTNLTTSDAGNYTCLMTNECGTTTTMVLQLTVSCLGTNTLATLEKAITLYPNPAKNVLNIKLPENININVNNVTIANSLGQIVLKQKTENTTTIDVSNLQKGVYIISLSTNYGNWNGKFVKE